jgi:hypothetical protein
MHDVNENKEIIIVRSMTDSDLGVFAVKRPSISSKQRAININAKIAKCLLSEKKFRLTEAALNCRILFDDVDITSIRKISKVGKNWRLGGNKLDGDIFSKLGSSDFLLIRSVENNDGASPVTMIFISHNMQRAKHAKVRRLTEAAMKDSMALYPEGATEFDDLALLFPATMVVTDIDSVIPAVVDSPKERSFPAMPEDLLGRPVRDLTIQEKVRSPFLFEQMFKASGDLSAHEHVNFLETVEALASQLRSALEISNGIIKLEKNHPRAWASVKQQAIGFVDGGIASLGMIGATPVAARVGGYVVRPGDISPEREQFIELKRLINELYASEDGGVYDGYFPDVSALRDAARISIEAAGAVKLIKEVPDLKYLFMHGALVNPISKYTDKMYDEKVVCRFPDFSSDALAELLTGVKKIPVGKEANFVAVYLRQLQMLEQSDVSVCGVIEREATTASVIRAVINNFDDQVISQVLKDPPAIWKKEFLQAITPDEESGFLGGRITDSLLFRCVLKPGEALVPVEIDRNDMRRAPAAWHDTIVHYPKPKVSYLQPTEWSSPIRLEIFGRNKNHFARICDLIYHCSLLLPKYAFPVGLDIVDKFARIPNWMSRPVNTNTAVQALKHAIDQEDEKLFNTIRRMLCGSDREWLLRPGFTK